MIILLDIDGVLVTQPSWKKVDMDADGFMAFNKQSVGNLADIISVTNAAVVLTTTHRITFGLDKWDEIFKLRGINIPAITKLNETISLADMPDRATEIKEWVDKHSDENYVIIDDDPSINNLSDTIKDRWVATKPFTGIDKEVKQKALNILLNNR
ncbi:HAD domain-containing protein [Mucilaginibacter dorajii]|uniref:FCP1 homology domain-containing protein n=1 Tax=Mucilaginibacter dorajii TaxID=692994 RepID=A0ABP7Q4S0_9SPHI|nr:HAD domain-containing protein [Mucilaginibacter dorajii]MCS3732668.1 phage tail sheath gpL-like [Mucilaginibacter dorajii]